MTTRPQPGIKELRQAVGKSRGILISIFVFSMFVNLLMLTGPLYMLQIYDRVLGSRSEATLVALSTLVIALYLFMGLIDFARNRLMAVVGARFQVTLDRRVFDAVQFKSLNPAFRASGSNPLNDMVSIQQLTISPVLLALCDIPWTPLFVLAIFTLHPLLGWVAVLGGVIVVTLTIANSYLTRDKVLAAQRETTEAQKEADVARHSAELIRAQGMEDAFADRWQETRQRAMLRTFEAGQFSGFVTAFTKSFRLLLQSSMLGFGAYLVLLGQLTPGAMIAGSILLGRALAPIEQTIGQWPMVQRARAAWKDLSAFLKATPVEEKRISLPKPKAHIQVRNLSVAAPGTHTSILRGLSFDVQPGQAIGVIGRSGAGKSSLARALLGLWQPYTGEIRLGAAKLDQYRPEELATYIGYLPQNVTLFNGTIAENIARMSVNPDHEAVVAAATKAQAHELILSLPDGYDTYVQGLENHLSGGERQRIALARALYGDPLVLVLDEPNSALDGDGSAALNASIRDFKSSERAVVIMTHRPMAISECDTLLMMNNGQVEAYGPRDEVLKAMVDNADQVQKSLRGARQ